MPIYLATPLKGLNRIDIILIMAYPMSFLLGMVLCGNNICDSVGTLYGSSVLSLWKSLLLGGIFEIIGCIAMGANVTKTISKGIIDIQ